MVFFEDAGGGNETGPFRGLFIRVALYEPFVQLYDENVAAQNIEIT
jgi:hypothetical protein